MPKKIVKKSTKKSATRKSSTRKAATRKSSTRKAATRKAATRKSSTRKSSTRKVAKRTKRVVRHSRRGGSLNSASFVIPEIYRINDNTPIDEVKEIVNIYNNLITTLATKINSKSDFSNIRVYEILNSFKANNFEVTNINVENLDMGAICGILYNLIRNPEYTPTKPRTQYSIFEYIINMSDIIREHYTSPSILMLLNDLITNSIIGIEIFEESLIRLPVDYPLRLRGLDIISIFNTLCDDINKLKDN